LVENYIKNRKQILVIGERKILIRSPNTTHSIFSSTKKKQGMQGRRLKWAGPIIYCGKYLLMQTNFTSKIFSHANERYKNIWSKTTLKTENKFW
jgi:hypothetical protein